MQRARAPVPLPERRRMHSAAPHSGPRTQCPTPPLCTLTPAPSPCIPAGGRAHLDTTSWAATRALTACLLRDDFGLAWWLPEGQLVPPVTNRANYLHWVNDLLALSAPEETHGGAAGAASREGERVCAQAQE